MVYCDFYPSGKTQYAELRDAMDKLSLNDASFSFEPESNDALGFGFRCGFLGLLHMEIVQERLEREFNIEIIQTAPTVTYEILKNDGTAQQIDSPSELPDPTFIAEIREPFIKMQLLLPQDTVGAIMKLCEDKRGVYLKNEYLGERVILEYELPLAEVIYDFYDRLKSSTKGYGTMDYEFIGFRVGNLVKVDILVNGDKVDAMSLICHRDTAEAKKPATADAVEGRDRQTPVRNSAAGRDRRQDHRARNHQERRQERHREVLRRRHLAETKTLGQAEGRQEAHEADGVGGYPAGSVLGDSGDGGVSEGVPMRLAAISILLAVVATIAFSAGLFLGAIREDVRLYRKFSEREIKLIESVLLSDPQRFAGVKVDATSDGGAFLYGNLDRSGDLDALNRAIREAFGQRAASDLTPGVKISTTQPTPSS